MSNLLLLDLRSLFVDRLIVPCQNWKKGINTTLILVLSLLILGAAPAAPRLGADIPHSRHVEHIWRPLGVQVNQLILYTRNIHFFNNNIHRICTDKKTIWENLAYVSNYHTHTGRFLSIII